MGPLTKPIDPGECVSKVERVCESQPPITTGFEPLAWLPGHRLLYLPPIATPSLEAFSRRLADAGFLTDATPLADVHHFTVAFFEAVAEESLKTALSSAAAPPGEEHHFEYVRLFALDPTEVRSLWRGRCLARPSD